jgi:hypothetical protein
MEAVETITANTQGPTTVQAVCPVADQEGLLTQVAMEDQAVDLQVDLEADQVQDQVMDQVVDQAVDQAVDQVTQEAAQGYLQWMINKVGWLCWELYSSDTLSRWKPIQPAT